jgi:hypothetical protein
MVYKTTTLMVAVHPEDDNPVFGERATHIRVEDEGGGSFLVISQSHDNIQPGEIRVDFEELTKIHEASKMLREHANWE